MPAADDVSYKVSFNNFVQSSGGKNALRKSKPL